MKIVVFHPLAEQELVDAVNLLRGAKSWAWTGVPRRSRTHSQLSQTIP
jgi:hypothetical protein